MTGLVVQGHIYIINIHSMWTKTIILDEINLTALV